MRTKHIFECNDMGTIVDSSVAATTIVALQFVLQQLKITVLQATLNFGIDSEMILEQTLEVIPAHSILTPLQQQSVLNIGAIEPEAGCCIG